MQFLFRLLMVFPMQSVELTNETVEFLRGIFELFDVDNVCPGLCFDENLIC